MIIYIIKAVVIGLVIIIFNIILLSQYFSKKRILNNGEKKCSKLVVAHVVDTQVYRRIANRVFHYYSYPIFEYEYNGRLYRTKYYHSSMAYSKDGDFQYQVGMDVALKINPDNPQEIFIEDDRSPYIQKKTLLICDIIVTIFFLIIGICIPI